MSVLYITTTDLVCPMSEMTYHPMLQNGVPCDCMGFPILPVYELLSEQFEIPQGVCLGFGQLANYDGLSYAVSSVNSSEQMFPKFVTDCFTEVVMLKNSYSRVLKNGLTFCCPISVPSEFRSYFQEKLSAVEHLGVTDESIGGAVRFRVDWQKHLHKPQKAIKLQPELHYAKLNYALRTVTPLCAFLPYDSGSKVEKFIPGELIREALAERLGDGFAAFAEKGLLRCTNVYPSCHGKRGLPTPASMVQRKLDRRVMLYRLTKDYEKNNTEITVKMNSFLLDPTAASPICFGVKQRTTFPVTASDNDLCGVKGRRGALQEGTVYRGSFEGSDEQIRQLAALFAEDPACFIGFYTCEGYGEAVITVESVGAEESPVEQLYRCFDLMFASDAIIYNRHGVSMCDGESILREIEQSFGLNGKLRIVGKAIKTKTVYPIGRDFKPKDTAVQSVAAGSILRLESVDDLPVDVSAMVGAFIGDRNADGYGELKIFPACDRSLRYMEEAEADSFETLLHPNATELQRGARFVREIMDRVLRYRVSLMALNDAAQGEPVSDEDLEVLFAGMRRKYNEECDIATMLRWYREAVNTRA